MTTEAIGTVSAVGSADPLVNILGGNDITPSVEANSGFASILTNMVEDVEQKVSEANQLVRKFAVDDSVPVHKVTFALEEARLSVEMMMQVRTRLVEGYREIMNMQM